jgi:hypothetical protein
VVADPSSPSPISFAAPQKSLVTPRVGAHTLSASHDSASSAPTGRRAVSLLNAKRSRGWNTDPEAEIDAGATIGPEECPAAAITHSMRKLKVKKSADGPAPPVRPRARRNSGFSSSDDEAPDATAVAELSSQNMKQLRRAKQLQSVQKKRAQAEAEAAAEGGQGRLFATLNHAATN